jgi:hypothetical protein
MQSMMFSRFICDVFADICFRLLLSKPSDTWIGGKGRINRQEIREYLFPFNDVVKESSIVLLCGSDTMVHDTFNPALEELYDSGWLENNVFVF